MRDACANVGHMSKMIQIRNVPDEVHRQLKVRAAEAGTTLSDYLLAEVRRAAERPSGAELRQRVLRQRPVRLSGQEIADLVREDRDRR